MSGGFELPCPWCGRRDVLEFTYGGEERGLPLTDPDAEFHRAVMRDNVAGPAEERWFHRDGCRSWFRAVRDTRTGATDG